MGKSMRAVLKLLKLIYEQIDLRDVFVFGGLSCMVYGISMISVAAAWITLGLMMAIIGLKK
jgi:hypothetical protein